MAYIFYALTSSTALSDSERMMAQMTDSEIVFAAQSKAPLCIEYCNESTLHYSDDLVE